MGLLLHSHLAQRGKHTGPICKPRRAPQWGRRCGVACLEGQDRRGGLTTAQRPDAPRSCLRFTGTAQKGTISSGGGGRCWEAGERAHLQTAQADRLWPTTQRGGPQRHLAFPALPARAGYLALNFYGRGQAGSSASEIVTAGSPGKTPACLALARIRDHCLGLFFELIPPSARGHMQPRTCVLRVRPW